MKIQFTFTEFCQAAKEKLGDELAQKSGLTLPETFTFLPLKSSNELPDMVEFDFKGKP